MASLISALVTSVYCWRASCWFADSPPRSKSPSLAIMYCGPLRPCTLYNQIGYGRINCRICDPPGPEG